MGEVNINYKCCEQITKYSIHDICGSATDEVLEAK